MKVIIVKYPQKPIYQLVILKWSHLHLLKIINPTTITIGAQSTITINNLANNPSQNDLSFTDVFPSEISLISQPQWLQQKNGCTGTFIGDSSDNFVRISNLIVSEGATFCSFSVVVNSNITGVYLNDTTNF